MNPEARRLRLAAAPLERARAFAAHPAVRIWAWTRLAVWAVALLAVWWFSGARNERAPTWGLADMRDVGIVVDVWARWDSAYFVRIAEHGYASAGGAAAFYPLYPGLIGVLGRALAGHYVLAGLLISLAASLAAFWLLHRLGERLLGQEPSTRAVLYLALFPMALYLQAIYSEAVFLLVAVAAFLLAERGRYMLAGVAVGLALLTRPVGFALLPAIFLLAWLRGARREAFAGLVPAGALFALFPLALWINIGDPLAFANEDRWHRGLSPYGPLAGLWHGTRAAVAGVAQLLAGPDGRVYWTEPEILDLDPAYVAVQNLQQFAFLVLYLVLTVLAWRRLGAPYGLFAALGLAIPLSVPSEPWPLLSIPRFGLVLFPLFLALGTLGARPRVHDAIVGTSSILLGFAVVQWALWHWVS